MTEASPEGETPDLSRGWRFSSLGRSEVLPEGGDGMIKLIGYVAKGNMPDIGGLADLRELLKWLDETWDEAKRDAEAWGLEGGEGRVVKLGITIEEEED